MKACINTVTNIEKRYLYKIGKAEKSINAGNALEVEAYESKMPLTVIPLEKRNKKPKASMNEVVSIEEMSLDRKWE